MSAWRLDDDPTSGLAPSTWLWLAVVVAAMASWASVMAGNGQHRQLAMLLVVAPLLEEIVIRAGLHDWLLRRACMAPAFANVLTAMSFGLAHVALRADISAFSVALPAMLIGEVYRRTARLRWCVVLHAALNAVWLGWNAMTPILPDSR